VPAVVVLLLGGGWVTGALITNDFLLSMVLTAAWTGIVGLACLVLFRRRREMWPALAAFVVTAAAGGIYLGTQTLIDDKVDENVVTARAPRAGRTLARTGVPLRQTPCSPRGASAPWSTRPRELPRRSRSAAAAVSLR